MQHIVVELGDIGGLKEALSIVFAFLFGIFNYNKDLENMFLAV
mgnify:CR=1 FL=1